MWIVAKCEKCRETLGIEEERYDRHGATELLIEPCGHCIDVAVTKALADCAARLEALEAERDAYKARWKAIGDRLEGWIDFERFEIGRPVHLVTALVNIERNYPLPGEQT